MHDFLVFVPLTRYISICSSHNAGFTLRDELFFRSNNDIIKGRKLWQRSLCVLYDDPVDGYPRSYPRDDVPRIDHYPGGQTLPTPKSIDFKPGTLLGSVSGACAISQIPRPHSNRDFRQGRSELGP